MFVHRRKMVFVASRSARIRLRLTAIFLHIYGVAGGGFLGFCLREAVTLPPTVVLTLVTEDVDGVYETLQQAGVKIEAAPKHHAEYGIYHFYAQGPSGERVEIQQFDMSI